MVRKSAKNAVRKKIKKQMDTVDYIMAYESGQLSEKETLKMFQKLVDTGQAWRLQGSYGRTASALLERGLIKSPKKKTQKNTTDYYGNKIKW